MNIEAVVIVSQYRINKQMMCFETVEEQCIFTVNLSMQQVVDIQVIAVLDEIDRTREMSPARQVILHTDICRQQSQCRRLGTSGRDIYVCTRNFFCALRRRFLFVYVWVDIHFRC